jgi:hypothetical protein
MGARCKGKMIFRLWKAHEGACSEDVVGLSGRVVVLLQKEDSNLT